MSCELVAWMAADVSPGETRLVTSTTSRSKPALPPGSPSSCGRSPARYPEAPSVSREPLKKLVVEPALPSESAVPLKRNWSPARVWSPS